MYTRVKQLIAMLEQFPPNAKVNIVGLPVHQQSIRLTSGTPGYIEVRFVEDTSSHGENDL